MRRLNEEGLSHLRGEKAAGCFTGITGNLSYALEVGCPPRAVSCRCSAGSHIERLSGACPGRPASSPTPTVTGVKSSGSHPTLRRASGSFSLGCCRFCICNEPRVTTRIRNHHFCSVRAILEVYFNVLAMPLKRLLFLLCTPLLELCLAPSAPSRQHKDRQGGGLLPAGCLRWCRQSRQPEGGGDAEAVGAKVCQAGQRVLQECQYLPQLLQGCWRGAASGAAPHSWTWS